MVPTLVVDVSLKVSMSMLDLKLQMLQCQWVLQEMLQENLHMYLAMMRHLRREVKIHDSQIALQPLAGLVVADI